MYVKKGDILFQIDMSDLKDKISKAKSDVKKPKLLIEDKQKSITQMKETNSLEAQKANIEYKYISSKETAIEILMENGLNELEKELKSIRTIRLVNEIEQF